MIEPTLENVVTILAIITPIGIAIAFIVNLRNKVNELQRELNRLKVHPLLVLFKSWENNKGAVDFLNNMLKSREVEKE